ncbi:RNA methyltransferase [Candidatus Gracilibacteria bacterium]|nr:MAG: RNA methyltransferase [Candidatus Gracilibacteria bacterium]
MLTKSKIQYIRNLHNKKGRYELGRFLVEGKKSINEVICSGLEIVEGFFVDNWISPLKVNFPATLISQKELARITTLRSNRDGIVIVKIPKNTSIIQEKSPNITLVLDSINDPGNLGTILRIADWYGISKIIASEDTVDIYNPKTLIASMGSFSRVFIQYKNLQKYLESVETPIFGADLDGENLHGFNFPENTPIHLVIGSESHGISPEVKKLLTRKITIPRFGHAESLNAGVATAVILDRMVGK